MVEIAGRGWELLVTRKGVHRGRDRVRTYGDYQVFRDGRKVDGLAGHMCECGGPGDNEHPGSGRRIREGIYPLWTHFGRYRTIGFLPDARPAGAAPMPGLLIEDTGKRTKILIHPAHPPDLFLSSTGCLNPTTPLRPRQKMEFGRSRDLVIALIEDLAQLDPAAFAHEISTPIAGAVVVIDGEPEPAPDTGDVATTAKNSAAGPAVAIARRLLRRLRPPRA